MPDPGLYDEYYLQYEELKAMIFLSERDPGMKDLLLRAKEYYELKGAPKTMDLLEIQLVEKENEIRRIEAAIMEQEILEGKRKRLDNYSGVDEPGPW